MRCAKNLPVKTSLMRNLMRRKPQISSFTFKKFFRKNLETEVFRKLMTLTRQVFIFSKGQAMTQTTSLLMKRRTYWSSKDVETQWRSRTNQWRISQMLQFTRFSTQASQVKRYLIFMRLFRLTRSCDRFPFLQSYSENQSSLTLNDSRTMTISIWTSQTLISLHLWEFESWLKGRASINQYCWSFRMWRHFLKTS